jgi:cytoskeletal protein CcmA (bactofilin family)
MKLQDLELAPGDWSDELEVGGTVIVPEGTRLTGGTITANDIILLGHMGGAELRACRKCTIGASAKVDWVRLKTMDLELGVGVQISPGKPIQGRHLHLHGKFSGNAVLTGSLVIYADGDFSGQLRSAGLQVEVGGGFRAQLDVNPANAPPPAELKKRAAAILPSKLRSPPPKARPTPPPKPGRK